MSDINETKYLESFLEYVKMVERVDYEENIQAKNNEIVDLIFKLKNKNNDLSKNTLENVDDMRGIKIDLNNESNIELLKEISIVFFNGGSFNSMNEKINPIRSYSLYDDKDEFVKKVLDPIELTKENIIDLCYNYKYNKIDDHFFVMIDYLYLKNKINVEKLELNDFVKISLIKYESILRDYVLAKAPKNVNDDKIKEFFKFDNILNLIDDNCSYSEEKHFFSDFFNNLSDLVHPYPFKKFKELNPDQDLLSSLFKKYSVVDKFSSAIVNNIDFFQLDDLKESALYLIKRKKELSKTEMQLLNKISMIALEKKDVSFLMDKNEFVFNRVFSNERNVAEWTRNIKSNAKSLFSPITKKNRMLYKKENDVELSDHIKLNISLLAIKAIRDEKDINKRIGYYENIIQSVKGNSKETKYFKDEMAYQLEEEKRLNFQQTQLVNTTIKAKRRLRV